MLPILNIPLENDNADRGKENGLSVLLFPGEKNHMVFSRERTKKRDVAKSDGYYTVNGNFFKAKKGQALPETYDTVVYDNDGDIDQGEPQTGLERKAKRIADNGEQADEVAAETEPAEDGDDEVAAETAKPAPAAKGTKKA
jgi:hypothetical protein